MLNYMEGYKIPAIEIGRICIKIKGREYNIKVKEGIRSQNPAGAGEFVALSQRTLKARKRKGFKGTKALLNRGHLLRSIRIKKVNKNEYFIGIHKNETYKTKDGEEKAMSIGAIHEYGKNIVYVSKTGKTVLIHIPARPYLRPVYKKMKKNIEFLYLSLLKKELKLDMK